MKRLTTAISAVVMSVCACAGESRSWTAPDGVAWRFECDVSNRTATIAGAKGYAATLNIPDRVSDGTNAYAVTGIAAEAFSRNADSGAAKIDSVVIPGSVTDIGDSAFYGCNGLKSITMRNGIKCIGARAFHDCSRLSSIAMPNSVTDIGEGAFSFCKGLVEVTIPGSVTNIGDYAFIYDDGLRRITFAGNAPVFGDDVFLYLNAECVICVPRSSTGWGVTVPGKWQGLNIEYCK